MKKIEQLMDYLATQEEADITYNASGMKLAVHSNASYLSEPQAIIRSGGHFFLSNEATIPWNNGVVLNIVHIIKYVMTSATEAELAVLYIMAREAVYIILILDEMGHKQPPTPIKTDYAMVEAVINGIVQQQKNKINGHEIPLATWHRMPGTIQNSLATKKIQLCILFNEAPPNNTYFSRDL